MRHYLLLFPFCLFVFSTSAQFNKPIKGAIQLEPIYDTCYVYNSDVTSKVESRNPRFAKYQKLLKTNGTAARAFQNSLATSKIEIQFSENFDDFPNAKEAFRFAADMWEMEIVSSVPIVIVADILDMGGNTIGQNSSNRVTNVPNAPDPTMAYVSSLGNAIAGVDLLPGAPDLIQTYNSSFDFYYGTDGETPNGLTDFVTIAFHEIGHGLGVTGSSNSGNGIGLNFGLNPMIWDFYIELRNGISILDLGFSSTEQQEALVSNNLFINGYKATKALNGIRPKIYAPSQFNAGSSYSHLDESAFSQGSSNSLMTPFVGDGEAIHDVGSVVRGIFQDIGWELAPNLEFDLGIANIVEPSSGIGLSDEPVTVIVGNRGIEEVENIVISYSIDGGEWVTEKFTGSLAPMQERQFTFSQPADLSTSGKAYTIEVKVNYYIDEYVENNSLSITVNNLLPIAIFPYNESFEGENTGWTVEGASVWELGQPAGSIINSASEGERSWVTVLDGNYPNESISYLLTPVFDFSNKQDPILEFDLWYDIEFGWDGATLQVSYDNGSTWRTVGEYNDGNNWYTDGEEREAASDQSEGDKGIDALINAVGDGDGWTGTGSTGTNGWVRARHSIPDAGGEDEVMLRFVFASDQAVNNEGIAIDNFTIIAPEFVANDVGITEILSPTSGNLGEQETIEVVIKNFGSEVASGFDLSYQVNEGAIITETYGSTLESGAEVSYSFDTKADMSDVQSYTIKTFTGLTGDGNLINDTTQVVINRILTVITFPYNESFEEGPAGWTAYGDSTTWELSRPDNEMINLASAGEQAWITGASDNYKKNEFSYLQSPGFEFTDVAEPRLAFDLWFETEELRDGLFIQYSTDVGSTWETIETNNEDDVNIYNTSGLNVPGSSNPGGIGWSGSSEGYRIVVINLPDLGEEAFVSFRFAFVSNTTNENEGVAIDNFRLFDATDISYTVTCPEDVEVNNDAGLNYASVELNNPIVEPSSGIITYSNNITQTDLAKINFPIGPTDVTFIIDVDGIVSTCRTNVVVTDNEPPVIGCPENKTVAVSPGTTDTNVYYNMPAVSDNYGFANRITYSNDQTVDGQSGIACPTGPNSFIRVFELEEDFGITEDFDISSVDVAVQVVNDGDVHAEGNFVPAKINLYLFDNDQYSKDNPAEFIFNNMTLLKSQDLLVEIGLENELINVPVSATVPAGYAVVLEFYTEAGSDQIFPGANPDSEADSYVVAANCNIPNPISVSHPDLNFPDSQWIMNINGFRKSNVLPTLTSGKLSGAVFPLGSTTVGYEMEDVSGNTSSCSFEVEVIEAELSAPENVQVAGRTSESFKVSWDVVDGVEFYQVIISSDNFESFLKEYNDIIVSGNELQVNGLMQNGAYYIKVRSVNNNTEPTAFSTYSSMLITSTIIESPVVSEPSQITDTQIRFSWNSIPNISTYEVDISTDDFSTYVSDYNSMNVEGNEILVDGLNPNTVYKYRVRARNSGDRSMNSNTGTATTLPAEPQAIPGSDISINGFMANWNSVEGADHYFLDVSTNNFMTFVEGYNSLQVDGTSHMVTGLNSNQNYQYRVRAYSSVGGESLNSDLIRVTTHAQVPVAIAPAKITDYGVTAVWKSFNSSTFELDLSSDGFETFIEDVVVNDTTKTIFDLTPNTTYSYRVRAVNRKGIVTSSSNIVSFTTPTADLSTPTATEATEIKNFSFRANWNAVSGALYYRVQISDDNFETVLDEFEEFDVYRDINGLEDDKIYYYRVKAFSNEKSSDFSNIIVANTVLGIGLINESTSYYPNPVEDILLINTGNNPVSEILTYNIQGQLKKVIVKQKASDNINMVVMENLPNGIYIINVRYTDGNSVSFKISKK